MVFCRQSQVCATNSAHSFSLSITLLLCVISIVVLSGSVCSSQLFPLSIDVMEVQAVEISMVMVHWSNAVVSNISVINFRVTAVSLLFAYYFIVCVELHAYLVCLYIVWLVVIIIPSSHLFTSWPLERSVICSWLV